MGTGCSREEERIAQKPWMSVDAATTSSISRTRQCSADSHSILSQRQPQRYLSLRAKAGQSLQRMSLPIAKKQPERVQSEEWKRTALHCSNLPAPNQSTKGYCCGTCTNARMEWDKYRPSPLLKDYAAVSTQNSKYRKYMEDECIALPKFKVHSQDAAVNSFFGVFDGHGGGFCSKYAKEHLHVKLAKVMQERYASKMRDGDYDLELCDSSDLTSSSGTDLCDSDPETLTDKEIEECYVKTFQAIDEELADHDEACSSGSTAVTCLIRKVGNRVLYHVANIGDSSGLLYSNGETTRITVDHRATNKEEAQRIRDSNGIIFNKRVAGVLSVTRALGHSDEKEFIISDPFVVSGEISTPQSFIVLMSDGISDVCRDSEVTEFVLSRLRRGEKAITICKSLLEESKERGAMDNMTVVLICFAKSYEFDRNAGIRTLS